MDFQRNDGGGFEKKLFKGNWKCAKCGKEITELPFEPSPDRLDSLYCRDCYRPKRRFDNNFRR